MQRITLLAAAAAATLLAHAPAYATASSSASLDSLSWTLIDLNTADGIAPSISFAGQGYVSTYTWNSFTGTTDSHDAVGTTVLDPISAHSSDGYSGSSGAVTASSLSSSGYTNGSTVAGSYGYYYGVSYLNGNYSNSFTLSPYTVVIFAANASTAASTTAPYNGGTTSEWANAEVGLYGSIGNNNNASWASSYFSAYSDNGGSSYSQSGPLFLTLSNSTNTALDGSLYGYAQSYGYSYAAAVPEPETYAMMLAGLGAVGLTARRRRRG